jgi:phosphoglycolate phosphatase-like HAD superfamily hydrolase
MPKKAIVFDIDGTLIDSVDLHTRAWQDALMEVGRQIRIAELRSQIGKGADMFLPAFSIRQRSSASAKVSKRQEEIFKRRHFSPVRPLASALQLFGWLQKGDWTVELASSRNRREVEGAAAVW